jgi:hypothetical protein
VGKPGPTSDKKIFEERQEKFDPKQKFQGDKAYQGGKSIKTPVMIMLWRFSERSND